MQEQNREKITSNECFDASDTFNQKKIFINSGLKLEDFYNYFFGNIYVLDFFIEVLKYIHGLDSRESERTPCIFTNHYENEIFIKFSLDIFDIIQSINKLDLHLNIQYPQVIKGCFSFDSIKKIKCEMNEYTSSMIIFYIQLSLNMFYNIYVQELINETTSTVFNNFYSLNTMQRKLMRPNFEIFLQDERVGGIVVNEDVSKDRFYYLDVLRQLIDKIEKPFSKFLSLDNEYNKKFIEFFGEIFFKLFTCFTNYTVDRYNILFKISEIFRIVTTKLCPILYKCTDSFSEFKSYITENIETTAMHLIVQQNERVSEKLILSKAETFSEMPDSQINSILTNNQYSFESCAISMNNLKSILDGLNYKLNINYNDNIYTIDPSLIELKETLISSYRNGTKNIELAQLLFNDIDLYSQKYQIISKSILPSVFTSNELNSILSLSFLKKEYLDEMANFLLIKERIDFLVKRKSEFANRDYLHSVEQVIIDLNNAMVKFLDLEPYNNDYQIYRVNPTQFYTTYKKQFGLINEGMLKSVFSLFDVIWQNSKYYLVRSF